MTFPPNCESLLVLIPAYNEEGAIRYVVNNVLAAVPDADVLVVDDGSADDTAYEAGVAGAMVVRHPFNLGIGGAVQTGLRFAWQQGYNTVIRLDGDGQHNAADIPLLHQMLKTQQADMVIGSRFLHNRSAAPSSFLRGVGIRLFAGMVSLLTRQPATDVTSGFIGFNRRAIGLLATYMPQDYPEVESRVICYKAGLKTVEIPVKMEARRAGVSSINAWFSLYYAFKVSVAVLITAFKDIPVLPKEVPHGYPHRAADNGYHPQPYLVARDSSVDTEAPAA